MICAEVRFDSISVGSGPDPAVIRLHPRLTVIGGVGEGDRPGMAELLVGAFTGDASEAASVRLVDGAGFGIDGFNDAGRWRWTTDDGASWVSPMSVLTLDRDTARRLMLLRSDDLGIAGVEEAVDDASPELLEARSSLRALEADLAAALGLKARVDALHDRITSIDEELRHVQSTVARRRRDGLLARREAVRIEAEILRDGVGAVDHDRRLIAAATTIAELDERWRQACRSVQLERHRFGDRERLDARTLAEALSTPDHVPPELDALAALYEAGEAQRALLADRLTALVTRTLPQPSHPAVVRLASADQTEVWATARSALEAEQRVEEQSLVFGGLEAEGVAAPAATDLEETHHALEVAQREAVRRQPAATLGGVGGLLLVILGLVTTPLLMVAGFLVAVAAGAWGVAMPRSEIRRRELDEQEALGRVGVPSYMTFHLRRLDVHLSPAATEPLEVAALEYRQKLAAWRRLAGDVTPREALGLEGEARSYAATIGGANGIADEIVRLREQLATEAEPSVARARARLVEACAPFGISDPQLAVELVRHQAKTSAEARLQAQLEEAERLESSSRNQLDAALTALGFAGHDNLEHEVDRYERARVEALMREDARHSARPFDEVEAELAHLEELLVADGADLPIVGIEDPAVESEVSRLQHDRTEAVAAYDASYRQVPDTERLVDRKAAMARRVAVLTGERSSPVTGTDFDDTLLARLTNARCVGPRAESVPVILVDPFELVHGEEKLSLLDRVERLSGAVQLVYLTDDVDVLLWARRHAPEGSISLLEPVAG